MPTTDQILNAISLHPEHKWLLTEGGTIRSVQVFDNLTGFPACPVATALRLYFNEPDWNNYRAACNFPRLADAADKTPTHDPILRQQLLKACRLEG